MSLALCPKDTVKKQSQPQGEEEEQGIMEDLVYQHGCIAPDRAEQRPGGEQDALGCGSMISLL